MKDSTILITALIIGAVSFAVIVWDIESRTPDAGEFRPNYMPCEACKK